MVNGHWSCTFTLLTLIDIHCYVHYMSHYCNCELLFTVLYLILTWLLSGSALNLKRWGYILRHYDIETVIPERMVIRSQGTGWTWVTRLRTGAQWCWEVETEIHSIAHLQHVAYDTRVPCDDTWDTDLLWRTLRQLK